MIRDELYHKQDAKMRVNPIGDLFMRQILDRILKSLDTNGKVRHIEKQRI